jgi:DNA primase
MKSFSWKPSPGSRNPENPERMPWMDNYSFRRLKAVVSIGQIMSAYGLDTGLRRYGDQLFGPCPLHGGDNPTAFRVHLERGLWRCFTHCGGGDCVELIRRIESCTFAEAARHLNRLAFGRAGPCAAKVNTIASVRKSSFKPFTRSIPLNPESPFLQLTKAITVATARRFEAGVAGSSPFLASTVAVRLHDTHGSPLGYCGRQLDPDMRQRFGKWRFPKNFPKGAVLYNAHRAHPFIKSGIIVVECPWAAMRLAQAGFPNAVALLGTLPSQIQIAWLSKARSLLLLLDGDSAGRKAATTIHHALASVIPVHIHQLPDQLEPEDLTDQSLAGLVAQYPIFS